MSNQVKSVPKFKNEDEEREFWAKQGTSDYFDPSTEVVNPKFPNLRKTPTRPVTLRMTRKMLADIKSLADSQDVPYQSLMKVFLADRIKEEKLKIANVANVVISSKRSSSQLTA